MEEGLEVYKEYKVIHFSCLMYYSNERKFFEAFQRLWSLRCIDKNYFVSLFDVFSFICDMDHNSFHDLTSSFC